MAHLVTSPKPVMLNLFQHPSRGRDWSPRASAVLSLQSVARTAKWTLKQVQGDEGGGVTRNVEHQGAAWPCRDFRFGKKTIFLHAPTCILTLIRLLFFSPRSSESWIFPL